MVYSFISEKDLRRVFRSRKEVVENLVSCISICLLLYFFESARRVVEKSTTIFL